MRNRSILVVGMALMCSVGISPLSAQQRADTLSKMKRDSIAAADSLRLIREFEQLQQGSARKGGDSTAPGAAVKGSGPTNPRLMPDISAVGDIIFDASPNGSTLSDPSKRADIREVEIAIQAAVDPYFRGDIFLGFSDDEKVSIEQAFLTTTALPAQIEMKIGRYLMPVGKVNVTHRHDLHTLEYPWVVQRFLGGEGLKGTGLWANRVFAPFGFYQELNLTAVDRFGERDESLVTAEPLNKQLSGLAYSARLRNYWDLGQATNLEVSGTVMTGVREQPVEPEDAAGVNAVGVRQTLVGGDLTLRWRPLKQGLYRSFILQIEIMQQVNAQPATLPPGTEYLGPTRSAVGGYAFARYQVGPRTFVGARYDAVGTTYPSDANDLRAASGYLEFFPSEFSKLLFGAERIFQGGLESGFETDAVTRLQLQAVFALGPHKPHPF